MALRTILCIIALCASLSESARILGMFPSFPASHHGCLQAVMKTLASAGHEVVVYSPYPLKTPHPNYTDVFLETTIKRGPLIDNFIAEITNWPFYRCIDHMWHHLTEMKWFQRFMEDKEILKLIASDEKFDVIFVESTTAQDWVLIMGHILKAPMIVVQTYPSNTITNYEAGNPLQIATMPDIGLGATNRMTFVERAMNLFSVARGMFIHNTWYRAKVEELMRSYFPDMPPLQVLTNNVSMYFINDHLTADYAQPRTPNILPIAGISMSPLKGLPQDLKKFMDEATHGVILFCLGTLVSDEEQPKEYFSMLINVFKKLKQRVIWKTRRSDFKNLPGNIRMLSYVPQVDVLAHPKCVLFITHGGINSQYEAIRHGVPVVGIPQFFDQYRNVKYFVATKTGVELKFEDLSEETLSGAIQEVIGDTKYTQNMKKLSQIANDLPMTPAQAVVFWTEYVIRHRGAPHLRPASSNLSWYQLYLLDVVAIIFIIFVACIIAIAWVVLFISSYIKTINKCTHQNKKSQ